MKPSHNAIISHTIEDSGDTNLRTTQSFITQNILTNQHFRSKWSLKQNQTYLLYTSCSSKSSTLYMRPNSLTQSNLSTRIRQPTNRQTTSLHIIHHDHHYYFNPNYHMYRTVDQHNNILEMWDTLEQVNPQLDYHKIQHTKTEWLDNRIVIMQEYNSLYDLHSIPF